MFVFMTLGKATWSIISDEASLLATAVVVGVWGVSLKFKVTRTSVGAYNALTSCVK